MLFVYEVVFNSIGYEIVIFLVQWVLWYWLCFFEINFVMFFVVFFCIEKDLFGIFEVFVDVYYGIQILCVVNNFCFFGVLLLYYLKLVVVLVMVKQVVVDVNCQFGYFLEDKYVVISEVCVCLICGDFYEQFVVDMIQGGVGIFINMNVNEVIVNIVLEVMGYIKGEYKYLYLNNDVNMVQLINDVYLIVICLGLLFGYDILLVSFDSLIQVFVVKGVEFVGVLKMGCIQLQDVVLMIFGQEFYVFVIIFGEDFDCLCCLVLELFIEVNFGGIVIGIGINVDFGYQKFVVECLVVISGQLLKLVVDLIEVIFDMGVFVLFFGMFKCIVVKLLKICNDLCLFFSGLCIGINEINLLLCQLGSLIMLGKVNLVILEVVNQVVFEVIGNDFVLILVVEGGQL